MDTHQNYTPDLSRPVATGHDEPRQAPTGDDYISIKEALDIFTARGRSVTERTLQRYCEKLQLDGQKQITAEGEKWFVRRSSVHRRIDELDRFDQLRASRQVATSPDVSPVVAEEKQAHLPDTNERQSLTPQTSSPVGSAQQSHTTAPDKSRHDATSRDLPRSDETQEPANRGAVSEGERELYERMITILQEQNADLLKDKDRQRHDMELLAKQLEVKDRQLEKTKDRQIEHFFSSERDTKTLLGSLQSLMNAIWPTRSRELGERYAPMRDALESGLERRGETGDGR